MNKIKEFQGEYRWLSNFWSVNIEHKGNIFSSVEHAYMSEKNNSEIWSEYCINTVSPKKVKEMSHQIILREDWEEVKLDIMFNLLQKKLDIPEFSSKFLETGDSIIEEGNDWGDLFWGVDLETGRGENHLGKMIMDIREGLKSKKIDK